MSARRGVPALDVPRPRGVERTPVRRRGFLEVLGGEDGSTLLMYPVAVLMVLVIGAVAIDAAVLFQAHRQAVDTASGLASDIAGIVDEAAFAREGEVRIDRDRAGDVLSYANEVQLAGHPNGLSCGAELGDDRVAVTCRGTGRPLLFTIGGEAATLRVEATVTASSRERG